MDKAQNPIKRLFSPYLIEDERLLWYGKGSAPFFSVLIYLWLIVLVGSAASLATLIIFWLLAPLPQFLGLSLIPLFFFGASFLLGRMYFFQSLKNVRTYYAITQSSILIKSLFPYGSFQSVSIQKLPGFFIRSQYKGVGTIVLGEEIKDLPFLVSKHDVDPYEHLPQLRSIADVQKVHSLLRQCKAGDKEIPTYDPANGQGLEDAQAPNVG